MRKMIYAVIAFCLIAMLACACSSEVSSSNNKSEEAGIADVSTEKSTPEPTKEPTPEPTKEPTPEPTKKPTKEPTKEPAPEPTKESEEEHDPIGDSIDLTFDEGNIRYVGFEKANEKLTDHENALVFLFEFTNYQKEPSQVQSVFRIQFFQNGKELSNSVSYSSEGGEQYETVGAFFSDVLKGGTLTFGQIAVPEDDSPITIMVSYNGWGTSKDEYQMMEVNLNDEKSTAVEESSNDYPEVVAAISQNTWLFNGGGDAVLNYLTFDEEKASIGQVYFDGNGYHDNGTNECNYSIDDTTILITTDDGGELSVEYQLSEGTISLGNGDYYTIEQAEEALQGYWMYSSDIFGKSEGYLLVDHGRLSSERASAALGGAPGEYFYYGPYDGTYTLGIGRFDTDMFKGSNWFYNIINGTPTVLNYDNVCSPASGFPGENGYSF